MHAYGSIVQYSGGSTNLVDRAKPKSFPPPPRLHPPLQELEDNLPKKIKNPVELLLISAHIMYYYLLIIIKKRITLGFCILN